MTENSKKIAAILLDIKAVKLNTEKPFQWSSGWKSPIYCDNRISLSFPRERTIIKESLAEMVKENYPDVDAIAGVATAGIPQGALVADILELPFIYIRSKPKGHGMLNMIEGKTEKGQKVVLIEDLISTGGSSIKAAKALQEANIKVLGLVAIFTYGFDHSIENFSNAGISFNCLSNYETLIAIALEKGFINKNMVSQLQSWREEPENWGN